MLRRYFAGGAILLGAVASSSASADSQFNLVCVGQEHENSFFGGEHDRPYRTTYRIDLGAKLYCYEDCQEPMPIEEVTDTRIVFVNKNIDTPSNREIHSSVIDRRTGSLQVLLSMSTPRRPETIMINSIKASCEKAEFTGFPKAATKF